MSLTRAEVEEYLVQRGFTLGNTVNGNPSVYRYGEKVGVLFENLAYIARYYPSLNRVTKVFSDTPMTLFMFTSPKSDLVKAIDSLLDSPRRIERDMRNEKLSNVKKYFKYRRVSIEYNEPMQNGGGYEARETVYEYLYQNGLPVSWHDDNTRIRLEGSTVALTNLVFLRVYKRHDSSSIEVSSEDFVYLSL